MTVTATPEPELAAVGSAKLGQEIKIPGASMTALDHRRHVRDTGAERGERWDAVLAKTCITDEAEGTGAAYLSWSPWVLADADSGQYPASSSTTEDFPVPEYPLAGARLYKVRQCAKGWIVFGAPRDAKLATMDYSNDTGESGTWSLKG